MLAVVGFGGLVLQWGRSDREFKLAEIKAAQLELDMARLRQQRTALDADVATRNTEIAILASRVDEAVAALQASELTDASVKERQEQLVKTAERLRSKVTSKRLVSGSIIASPDTIAPGESARLGWNSFDATDVVITPHVGRVAPRGRIQVSPDRTTTYTLTISNESGSVATGTATVFVRPRAY
jgi:hypothetical protein